MNATKKFIESWKPTTSYPEAKLTPKQVQEWNKTRAKFLWECPGFSHILYQMMAPTNHSDDRIIFTDVIPSIAATDGQYMLASPKGFLDELTLPQRVFVMGHEVLHGIFNHMGIAMHAQARNKVSYSDGTSLPYVDDIMQVAADLVINDILVESEIGEKPPKIYHMPKLIPHTMSVIDAYRILYKQSEQRGGGKPGEGVPGVSGQGFDQHLKPGTVDNKPAQTAQAERNDQEWKTAVQAAMASAAAQGKLPGALKHLFAELLQPQISWQEHIVAFFARKVGSGSWNFRRPDRRWISREEDPIYIPSRSGHSAECVVVGVDTSGSINSRTLDLFMGEMSGILEEIRPKRLVIMWCDAKVHRVDEAEDATDLMIIRAKGAPGRGGTSFVPVFKEIAKMGLTPDALVYLTDGMGKFPDQAPAYPVLWGNINKGKAYPFGTVVDIPKVA